MMAEANWMRMRLEVGRVLMGPWIERCRTREGRLWVGELVVI